MIDPALHPDREARAAAPRDATTPDAAPPCELLPWDSEFWGFPIGRVVGNTLTPEHAARVDDWAHDHAVRCVYFLARPDDPTTTRAAEDGGFRLVDVRVTMTRRKGAPLPQPAAGAVPVRIRESRPEDVELLCAIARRSHGTTRFYADPNFPNERCADLYATWIERSCNGYDDVVLVAEVEQVPAGYITCNRPRENALGTIGLMATDERGRRHGVAASLVAAGLSWLEREGATRIAGGGQARNPGIIRLVERYGFSFKKVDLWFHKWYGVHDLARERREAKPRARR